MRRVQLELDELLGMDLCAQPLDLAPQGVRAGPAAVARASSPLAMICPLIFTSVMIVTR